jgi:hypothetical protein
MEKSFIGPWRGYDPRDDDWHCSFVSLLQGSKIKLAFDTKNDQNHLLDWQKLRGLYFNILLSQFSVIADALTVHEIVPIVIVPGY